MTITVEKLQKAIDDVLKKKESAHPQIYMSQKQLDIWNKLYAEYVETNRKRLELETNQQLLKDAMGIKE